MDDTKTTLYAPDGREYVTGDAVETTRLLARGYTANPTAAVGDPAPKAKPARKRASAARRRPQATKPDATPDATPDAPPPGNPEGGDTPDADGTPPTE